MTQKLALTLVLIGAATAVVVIALIGGLDLLYTLPILGAFLGIGVLLDKLLEESDEEE